MRENRTCGSEGGEGQSPSRPLLVPCARKDGSRVKMLWGLAATGSDIFSVGKTGKIGAIR